MDVLLETARLLLRSFRPEDLPVFAAYRSDPEVARYQSWVPPYTEAQARTFLASLNETDPVAPDGWFQVALELKKTGEMIGDLGFCVLADNPERAEIGFTLAREHWRRGYAEEAVRRLFGFLFMDLGVKSVCANCDLENAPSWRLMERLGMTPIAPDSRVPFKGGWCMERWYGLDREVWRGA
jgi:RimJ/RimL family protein N-acetyltransferase